MDFFSSSGFEIQSDFDYRTSKIKIYSVRALKFYLNEKNLIHGQVTETISKFSPQIFETLHRQFLIVGSIAYWFRICLLIIRWKVRARVRLELHR